MEEVLGLGGLALPARDPAALARWYRDRLGLRMIVADGAVLHLPAAVPESLALRTFARAPGRPAGSGAGTCLGLTLRVRALDAMMRQLQRAGIAVESDPEVYSHGVFARLSDPEGNTIVLWEAVVSDARD
ncbi:MAG: VOC family protein [Thermoleophilia bacterium]|nr:VOC family protein [Thermoleophilia bacterium]